MCGDGTCCRLLLTVKWQVQLKQFAMTNSVHVWLVAHPKQLNAWKGAAPTLYDISGSAHFNNKADVGMVVHRDLLSGRDDTSESPKIMSGHPLENDPFACQVIIRKVAALPFDHLHFGIGQPAGCRVVTAWHVQVRNRDAGRIGHVYLKYDRSCGRYYDVESIEGKEICPVKPLFSSKAPQESLQPQQGTSPEAEPDLSDGNHIQNMMDHGGFL